MGSYKVENLSSCVSEIRLRLKGDIIKELNFTGGCKVIYQALNKLIIERNINEVIDLLSDIDTKCVNESNCIIELRNLLINSRKEEICRVEEINEYRVSPAGFYKSISILYGKPNIDFDKKYVLVKVNPLLYDKVVETIKELPEYINQYREEKSKEFLKKKELLEKKLLNPDLNKDSDTIQELIKEKEEALERVYSISEKVLKNLSTLKIEKNDNFEGDYIFNTIWWK